jgi:hypothetical protein
VSYPPSSVLAATRRASPSSYADSHSDDGQPDDERNRQPRRHSSSAQKDSLDGAQALSFAAVAQDGDEERILKMDRSPTVSEAEAIRRYIGVSKKPDFTERTLEQLRALFASLTTEPNAEVKAIHPKAM